MQMKNREAISKRILCRVRATLETRRNAAKVSGILQKQNKANDLEAWNNNPTGDSIKKSLINENLEKPHSNRRER